MSPEDEVIQVEETWVSADLSSEGAVDSPAFWAGGGENGWVIASEKVENTLYVLDAGTGEPIPGIEGPASSGLKRPNGLVVWGRHLLVVERDARRVKVLGLPEFEVVGTFGEEELIYPYGMTIHSRGDGVADVWVTDEYRSASTPEPPTVELARSVKHFRVQRQRGILSASLVHAFGEETGPSGLSKVESISFDHINHKLYVADEADLSVRVFQPDGRPTGELLGRGYIQFEPEGIVSVDCGSTGYVVITDQDKVATRFHVLDGSTLHRLGTFKGLVTAGTDGIAFTNQWVGSMRGALFAVHADKSVSAFSWAAILEAMKLPACDVLS